MQLQIWDRGNGANQTWTHTSSNQLTVTTGGVQMCLDAYNSQTANGAKVVTWPCNGQSDQQGRARGSRRAGPARSPGR
ncbi:ricin-type beta-trefoil lectin domain protein [Kitasatospora sp. NBC_00315]|uniref:ricin-type beta-trefoil lectin domain protein n=1 Tax=Kitasatospora sp. NBC_00315 TaxID=2975963 RepID=UPI00352E1A26